MYQILKTYKLDIDAEAKGSWDGFRCSNEFFEHVIVSHTEFVESTTNIFTVINVVFFDVAELAFALDKQVLTYL